jgi:fibronectin-binding autotransporter adhesin
MHKSPMLTRLLGGCSAVLFLFPFSESGRAQTIYTNSSTSGSVSWLTGPNWSATPLSSSNTAIRFQGTLGGNLTITQDTGANFVLNALTLANSGAFAMNFTGGAFEFSKNGTTNPALTFVNNSSTIQTFSNNFVLNDTLTVNQAGATVSNSTIAGVISGAGGLRKSGNGYVYLTGTNNSFGGGVTNSAGTLFVASIGNAGSNSSLGTNGTIVLGDGSGTNALRTINTAAETSDKVISLGGSTINTRLENYSGGVLTLNGAIDTVTNAGKVLYIVARSNNVVLGGAIATNNAASNNLALYLTNSSTSTLTLTASNAFRGGVTVQSGNLSVSNSAALGSGAVNFLTNSTLTALTSVNLTNNISVATGMTVAVNATQNAGLTNQISGEVSGAGGLRINTAGATTYLANANNSFGGGVHVQQGTYVVASVGNAGGNSSLGTNGTVKLGNAANTGTLQWLGVAAETTDKVFDLAGTTGGGTINASGAGLFRITQNLSTSGSGAKTLTLSGSGTGEFSGVIGNSAGGDMALTKVGFGTWTLSGSNNYSGATAVSAGSLIINGNQTGAIGVLTVAAGATLGGSGTIGGATTVSGVLSPGNSIGTLTVNNDVTWNGGQSWVFELGAAGLSLGSPGTSDLLALTGANDFIKGTGVAWTLDFAGTGALGWYKLVDWTGGSSTFNALDFSGVNLANAYASEFTILNDALYVNVVPEPSTFALVALAGAILAGQVVSRRRRS